MAIVQRLMIKLGNTYPYTEKDWKTTLQLAEETGL